MRSNNELHPVKLMLAAVLGFEFSPSGIVIVFFDFLLCRLSVFPSVIDFASHHKTHRTYVKSNKGFPDGSRRIELPFVLHGSSPEFPSARDGGAHAIVQSTIVCNYIIRINPRRSIA
jgi:hypothetical protein